jgi:hypothetical protein
MSFPLFRLLIVERQLNLPLAQFSSVAERGFWFKKIRRPGGFDTLYCQRLGFNDNLSINSDCGSVQKMHEAVFLVNHPRLFEFPPLERAEGFQA